MDARDKAIEAAAWAVDALWGGRYAPHVVEELGEEMGAALNAAVPVLLDEIEKRLTALAISEREHGTERAGVEMALSHIVRFRAEWEQSNG